MGHFSPPHFGTRNFLNVVPSLGKKLLRSYLDWINYNSALEGTVYMRCIAYTLSKIFADAAKHLLIKDLDLFCSKKEANHPNVPLMY